MFVSLSHPYLRTGPGAADLASSTFLQRAGQRVWGNSEMNPSISPRERLSQQSWGLTSEIKQPDGSWASWQRQRVCLGAAGGPVPRQPACSFPPLFSRSVPLAGEAMLGSGWGWERQRRGPCLREARLSSQRQDSSKGRSPATPSVYSFCQSPVSPHPSPALPQKQGLHGTPYSHLPREGLWARRGVGKVTAPGPAPGAPEPQVMRAPLPWLPPRPQRTTEPHQSQLFSHWEGSSGSPGPGRIPAGVSFLLGGRGK